MRRGRLALLLASTAYVVALVWAALLLPDRVPSHFDAAGRVDDWSSRTSLLVTYAVIGLFVLVGIPALTRALISGDGRGSTCRGARRTTGSPPSDGPSSASASGTTSKASPRSPGCS